MLCVCDDNVLKKYKVKVRIIIVLLYFYATSVCLIYMNDVCMCSYIHITINYVSCHFNLRS